MSIKLLQNIESFELDILESKIKKICSPLFSSTKLTFFEYNKSFLDYSRITVTTNAEWVYTYYNSGYYTKGMHHRHVKTYRKGYNYWNSAGRNVVNNLAKDNFNIDNGFTIIEPSSDVCEFYHFASMAEEKNTLNFYFNYINLLYRFIAYFKCEAQDIISYYSKNRIRLKADTSENIINNNAYLEEGKLFPVKKFYFQLNDKCQYLTNREIDIATWILNGKSSEEIGIILGISKKTVDAHVDSIKAKLDCFKQSQVIMKLIDLGFNKIIGKH